LSLDVGEWLALHTFCFTPWEKSTSVDFIEVECAPEAVWE